MRITTEKQKNASRENGRKSKGPIPLTKRHQALCARTVVLDNERTGAFKAVLNEYRDQLQPATQLEEALVEGIAAEYWRLRRAWAVETSLLNQALPPEPSALSAAIRPDAPKLLQDVAQQMQRTSSAFTTLSAKPEYRSLLRNKNDSQRAMQRTLRTLFTLRRNLPPSIPDNTPSESEPEQEKDSL